MIFRQFTSWFRVPRRSVFADERGVSAVEFALLAPLLVLACLATVEVGLAINEKMEIDHSLRAGSEGAMLDLGQAEVGDLVKEVASESFTIATSSNGQIVPGSPDLSVSVVRFCTCPESVSTAVNCSTGACAASAKPYLYYRLTASKTYKSILLPEFPLAGSVLVQVQ